MPKGAFSFKEVTHKPQPLDSARLIGQKWISQLLLVTRVSGRKGEVVCVKLGTWPL